jgi:hypothetical protein
VKIYSYVVDHDEGREPNPYFRVCTLCCCKFDRLKKVRQNVVELAKEGDWIIGTGGANLRKSAGHGKLVYAMRVDEKPTREEYYKDPQFAKKKPKRPLTILRSTGNLLSSRDTSTTSGRMPLIFESLNSKGILVDSTTSIQWIFSRFLNG